MISMLLEIKHNLIKQTNLLLQKAPTPSVSEMLRVFLEKPSGQVVHPIPPVLFQIAGCLPQRNLLNLEAMFLFQQGPAQFLY